MNTEIERQSALGATIHTGTVIAVCYSPDLIDSVGKAVHQQGEITRWGIPGDYHFGETRYSQSAKKTMPNDRPITVVGGEATREVCARLGVPNVPAGGLGENLLLEGAGDLGDLLPGDEIRVLHAESGEPSVVLQVRLQNEPCSNLMIYHKQMVKELYGKRGVICTVSKEGHVQAGDKVEIVRKNS